jgi:hypothetical protein
MSLFFLTYLAIYGGTHVYVFLKARAVLQFGPRVGIPLAALMAVMVVAPILVRIAEGRGHEFLARAMSVAGYVWMGVVFLFFASSLALDALRVAAWAAGRLGALPRGSLAVTPAVAFFLPLAVALLCAAYASREAGDLRVERLSVTTDKLPPGIERVRVAQISDVHLGLIVRDRKLQAIVDRVREAAPDVLVSTGDLVDGQINEMRGMAEALAGLHPPLGAYAITGNHEFYAGPAQSLAFTRRAGFRLLRGEAADAGGVLTVVGLDDPAFDRDGKATRAEAERALLEAAPRDRFVLLLKHRPGVDPASLGLFDLQLSGHTHRGQIFPFRYVVKAFYSRIAGLYRLDGGSLLYVSRGSGTWGPPMRLLSPPEITIIDIHSPSANAAEPGTPSSSRE